MQILGVVYDVVGRALHDGQPDRVLRADCLVGLAGRFCRACREGHTDPAASHTTIALMGNC